MRQPRDIAWSVEIAPRAWEQLGVVPGDVFRRLKRALDAVAAELQQNERGPAGGKHYLNAGGYVARYRMELEPRSVVLEDVRTEANDELTATGRRRRKT